MDYTEEDLLALIERHDEHEDYYRAQLAELRCTPEITLPDGWTKRHHPFNRLGADISLYDAAGTYIGSYGAVPGYRGGDGGWWEAAGSRRDTEQACIDYWVARAEK